MDFNTFWAEMFMDHSLTLALHLNDPVLKSKAEEFI